MNKVTLKMDLFTGLVMSYIKIWNKEISAYSPMYIALDTGASITTLSKDVLHLAGYDVFGGVTRRITTASGVEFVKEVTIDRLMLGGIVLNDVMVYAHTFPQESFSSGVLGINVLSLFDVNLLFSKQIIELTMI
jgi:predicted aspartyl protease